MTGNFVGRYHLGGRVFVFYWEFFLALKTTYRHFILTVLFLSVANLGNATVYYVSSSEAVTAIRVRVRVWHGRLWQK